MTLLACISSFSISSITLRVPTFTLPAIPYLSAEVRHTMILIPCFSRPARRYALLALLRSLTAELVKIIMPGLYLPRKMAFKSSCMSSFPVSSQSEPNTSDLKSIAVFFCGEEDFDVEYPTFSKTAAESSRTYVR